MNRLKSFIVIDNATKYEYGGSDCSFFQDGVVCSISESESIFIKNGDFSIEEYEVTVSQETWSYSQKVEEIYFRLINDMGSYIGDKLKLEFTSDYQNYIRHDEIDRSYNGKIYHIIVKYTRKDILTEANYEEKQILYAKDFVISVFHFAFQSENKNFLDWVKSDIEKYGEKKYRVRSVDDILIGADLVKHELNLDMNEMIQMGASRYKIQEMRYEMERQRQSELREIAKEMAMKEL
jgi:hypothetical protein